MHSLLKRQLRRCFGDAFAIPEEWRTFIGAVDDAYREFDSDRRMLERSLDLSSQELLEANTEMRAIFQAIPDLLFRLDSDGRILSYEANGTDDFFIDPRQLAGKRIQDVPFKEAADEFRAAIERVKEEKSTVHIEYCLTIQNEKHYYEARLAPFFDDQLIAIIRKISERKRAEEAVRESRRRLADIIDFLPDATFVIDRKGRIIAWNKAMEAMTKINAADMLDKGDYEYALPFYGIRRPMLIDLVLHPDEEIEGKYAITEKREGLIAGEAYMPALRGGKAYFLSKAGILRDSNGDIAGAIESIRDITERREFEEALARAEEKYRSIFENAVTGIYQSLPEGRFINANPAMARILGYESPEELSAVTDISTQMYVGPERRAELLRMVEEKGVVQEFEVQVYRKDGSVAWVSIGMRAVHDAAGKTLYYEGAFQDITDRKALEARLLQTQKMEAIGTLAGGIAHDFNNILAAIMGYTEMTSAKVQGEESQRYLEQVLKACDRAKNLVAQILTFSRKSDQDVKPTDIGALVKEALNLMRATLPTTIKIRTVFSPRLHAVLADPTQIHQILVNLCTNASHAMRTRGGTLEATLSNLEVTPLATRFLRDLKPGPYVKLSVSDTGTGIDPSIVDRIFDPFFTTKKRGEGTGLGLSVAYGIVKDRGGTITVYSEPGKGSVFNVYLPAIAEDTEPLSKSPDALPRGRERILFVDDEEVLVEMVREMLQELGYQVTAAGGSEEAAETFRSAPDRFDMLITDMTMPGMTGVDLAREVHSIRKDIPIILCTGFSELITEQRAKNLGISELVMKPFSGIEIARTVRRILDAKG